MPEEKDGKQGQTKNATSKPGWKKKRKGKLEQGLQQQGGNRVPHPEDCKEKVKCKGFDNL